MRRRWIGLRRSWRRSSQPDRYTIGVPVQIVVGKVAAEGKAEIRDRATKTVEAVPEADILVNVQARIAAA